MLHHRFPNGFTDLFMDETDREVSTLTDRAFRSLCVGDDAVYNDEFLYGYSPFSCHKPLVGEPLRKTHKESKKQSKSDNKNKNAQVWKQQQHKNHMSSFLKAISATEESCKGLLLKNGGVTDSNGESWDKSALRSIQKELSEFSEYHTSLTGEHYKNHLHKSGDGSSHKTAKDSSLPSGKSSKVKNGKSTVKLKKLNIKNFFLHSELSPFQTWRDSNQFPFGQEEMATSVLPIDNIPKWYDLSFYKELTEAHRKETLHTEELQSCQKTATEPPPIASKPTSSPPPPIVLPKPSATPAEKRCSSDGVDGKAAPWRRNRSRAKSAIQVSQSGKPGQDSSSKTVDESLGKKEARSVEVKAVEEVSSLASTPFSICQLMTPLIPSRQPTETSEILSPSALDLPLRPHSEAKVIPEPPIKRDSYKSLASSILFNLKDNRKRVKSRYSPPKFKTLELPESGTQSPQSDYLKDAQAGSEGNASELSTPAIFRDGLSVCSPILEPTSTKHDADRPLSDDYLLSNLLQTKREAAGSSGFGEENNMLPLTHSKKNKSPMSKKQNYPSLNLYKKFSPVDSDMKYLHVPVSTGAPEHIDQLAETNEPSPLMLNEELSPNGLPTNTGLSPNTLNVSKNHPPIIPPYAADNERLSSNTSERKRPPNVPDKGKQLVKGTIEKDFGAQPTPEEKDTKSQSMITMDVIRAAREAINAAKSRVLCVAQLESNNKSTDIETDFGDSKETLSSKKESSAPDNCVLSQGRHQSTNATMVAKNSDRREPPPVPDRTFAKSDLQLVLDKQQTCSFDIPRDGSLGDVTVELPPNENESSVKQGNPKHTFSAKQNNFIKYQRHTLVDDEQLDENREADLITGKEIDAEKVQQKEMRDSEHIINDLHALKELERARLGDRILENTKNRVGSVNIDEETKAKNDLISKELRNIKKGMLSMRGNTLAKRELFAKKEKEQRKQEAFTKIDSNVIVNKALINDNYDKAKMALEEIISDRQKRMNKSTEEDGNPAFEDCAGDESYITRVQQSQKAMAEEKHDGRSVTLTDQDLKERLSDLRDHNHMKEILAQSEPRFGESHRWGGRIALPGMNKSGSELNALLKTKAKPANSHSFESEEVRLKHESRQVSEETGENLLNDTGGTKLDAPPVPPRSKRGGNRSDASVTKATENLNYVVDKDFFDKDRDYENSEAHLKEMSDAGSATKLCVPGQHETTVGKNMLDVANNANSNSIVAIALLSEPVFPSHYSQSENTLDLSPELREDEAEINPTKKNTPDRSDAKVEESSELKSNHNKDQPDKINRTTEEINEATDALSEIPRSITSPLLLVNGVSVNQSPPDQASLSSKSSYFSVESALHRNTETESNVYHSLENLVGDMEDADEEIRDASRSTQQASDRTEVEYYTLSDQESEPEVIKCPIISCEKGREAPNNEGKEGENTPTDHSLPQDEPPESPSNTLSPALGIPALFKVKDNTFSNKLRKTVQPWSPRASLGGLEREEEELHQIKVNPQLLVANQTITSDRTLIPAEIFKPKDVLSSQSLPQLVSPSNVKKSENPKNVQDGRFLTVPQEEDRSSGVSPSSEGVESLTTSTADTADEFGINSAVLVGHEVPNVPSERSGSTCSGNESQTGLPKPPAVLPKSEKAVLKAIKLTNRRIKKEETQKSSHRSSQSSSKNKADRRKSDKSENKSSSSSRTSRSGERKHRDKTEDGPRLSQSHHGRTNNDSTEQPLRERGGDSSANHHSDTTETSHKSHGQRHSSGESKTLSTPELANVSAERQGRSSNRHVRQKLDQRNYSSDRVISNVPVYKALVGERPMSDRPFHRSQSIDRYVGDKVERKQSVDMSFSDKLDPRNQHIEKPIVDELQQRGRARDKGSRDNPLRRSHSIDAYSTEVPHPTTLSRQSSHTSQLSCHSSIEHTIVTQSFPMTQRKLLQDPDSGQYFFVDMPVQVKTKTFFDPETGSYVQLPLQPPEGAIPQAPPMEVLTPPLVVYHSFVPVPLSPLAQKATLQPPYVEPEGFEQRRLERSRQTRCKEGHPYLEPIYSQHEHMLGEFLGTEELDCVS